MARSRSPEDPSTAPRAQQRLAYVLADLAPRRASVERGSGDLEEEVDDEDELDGLPPVPRFSRLHVGVVVGLLLVGLLGTGWSLLRARPVALASPTAVRTVGVDPSPAPAASPTAGSTPAAAPTPTAAPTIVVHVLGAVRRPGLVQLPEPARVQDALDAAGGMTRDADPDELNLAQLLSDGEQVVIGTRHAPAGEVRDGSGGGGGPPSQPGGASTAPLDLNRATEGQLEALPGVGPVTAGKILAWRTEHHRFSRVEELQEVDGIGPKTFAQIAPHVRV